MQSHFNNIQNVPKEDTANMSSLKVQINMKSVCNCSAVN
jgi:hypothetical protein